MRLRNLFLGAIAMMVAFSACDQNLEGIIGGIPSIELQDIEGDEVSFDADGGECQVSVVANRKWSVENSADWILVNPVSGKASEDKQVVTIKVIKNDLDDEDPYAGFDREASLRFTVEAKSVYLTIKQSGPQGSLKSLVVYYNDFDKEKAQKTDGAWSTYLDSFDGWKNESGSGIETVNYVYDRITARTNSSNGSAGSHSLYSGSGMNYLWFGSGKPYIALQDIAVPAGKVDFTVSFGAERYQSADGDEVIDNTFNWDEFKAYVSLDAKKWALLDCTFAGEGLPDGKWDLASATIRVPEGTEKLSFYFISSKESAYAIDDFKLEVSLLDGVAVNFAEGSEFTPGQAEEGEESDAAAIYSNNYDKLEAKKEYGTSNSSFPYLDQFDGWMNAAGTGASAVTYAYNGMSARANSYSNGSYSDYEGSGLNNLFFGSSAYFATNGIALDGATDLTLTFGTEKYSQENGSQFKTSEFHIWLSNDGGAKWVEFTEYTFAGTADGRWNVATANFTVPAGTETLSICMQVDVASSYRMDDMKLVAAATAGTPVDFTAAVEKNFAEGNQESGDSSDETAIYSNNYDKSGAVKSGNYWPTFSDTEDCWKNAAGTGIMNVTYASKNVTVRNNSNSDGSYSDYDGSGLNNLFFGKEYPFVSTNNIALGGATDLTFTLGIDKYSQSGDSQFRNSEFHIWLSNDGGTKWVEFTEYTFAGTAEGRWNVATANFTVPSGTESLSICLQVDVESVYRIDDFKLVSSSTAGTAVDFSAAVERDFSTEGGSTGGDVPVTPEVGEGTGEGTEASPYDALKAQSIAATLGSDEKITGVYVKGTIVEIKEVSTSYGNATYWITDATGAAKFYVYRGYGLGNTKFTATDDIKVGDTVVIYGDLMNYMSDSPQLGTGNYIVELSNGEGGNDEEEPAPEPEPGDVMTVTVAQFLAATDNDAEYQVSGTISGIYQAYNASYGNISIYISDETGEMLAYRVVCDGIEDPANTITKGDLITVRGKRTLYNDVPQMAQGGVIVAHTDVIVETPAGAATLSFADTANRTVFTTSQQVWEQNGVKLINDKSSSTSNVADYSAPARFYKSSKLTVECAGMTKIEFVCNNGSYATALSNSITTGTATVNGSVVTVVLSAPADSYVISTLSAQVRMDSMTVYSE